MLIDNVANSSLYQKWLTDQQISFSSTLRLAKSGLDFNAFEAQLDALEPSLYGDSTLHLLSQLVKDENDWIRDKAKKSKKILSDLSRAYGINHQALNSRAAIVLRDSKLNFTDFLQWATRISAYQENIEVSDTWLATDYLWNTRVWDSIRAAVESSSSSNTAWLLDEINANLSWFSSPKTRSDRRIIALCAFYSALENLFEEKGVPPVLHRLSMTLLNMQLCWPIQVITLPYDNETTIGLLLPFFPWITEDGRSTTTFQSIYLKAKDVGGYLPPDEKNPYHRFAQGCLEWDPRWHASIHSGFQIAKSLWRSQNGRLHPEPRDRKLCSSLAIDFSPAMAIVSPHSSIRDGQAFVLKDSSAQAYWVQVALGLMLPAGRIPLGLVTGTVLNQRKGEYLLGDVEGLEQKLILASASGFLQKMILPATPYTLKTVRTFREGIVSNEVRSDLLENNLCKTVRDTADVLHTAGWRRATFIGAAETRRAFSRLTQSLFELDDKDIVVRPTLEHPNRGDWNFVEEAYRIVGDLKLSNDLSEILLRSTLAVSEKQLGFWLAFQDHAIRTGQQNDGFGGSGIGVLCIRTHSNESDMRFWAHVFDALEATAEVWERFQFGSLVESAQVLADLLNNFDADPNISKLPAPDFLVILDEAGATQAWDPRTKYEGDIRGSLQLLLNTYQIRIRDMPHALANALLQRDNTRERIFGRTRILVITGGNPLTTVYSKPQDRMAARIEWQDALSIFRNGFSIHDARAVINRLRTNKKEDLVEWDTLKDSMQALIENDVIFSSRGEYYFTDQNEVNTLVQFNADIHEAAGLSFMPLIASTTSSAASRRLEVTTHQIREATWHFQQMYDFAKNRAQADRSRKYRSAIAFLDPNADWDTVTQLSFDKLRFGSHGFKLAQDLIFKEQLFGTKPHTRRFIDTINAGTNALLSNVNAEEQSKLHKQVGNISAEALRCADCLPAQLAIESEKAFYLRKREEVLGVSEFTGNELFSDIRGILQDDQPASRELVYQLSHGWLEKNWESDNWLQNLELAYLACLTDATPVVSSWLKILSLLYRPKDHRELYTATGMFSKVLALWDIRVFDSIAFGFKVHYVVQRGRVQKPFMRHELFSARQNFSEWSIYSQRGSYELYVLEKILSTLHVRDIYPMS